MDTAPEGVVGTPGSGFTVTETDADVLVPQALVEVTATVALPENEGFQLTVPVVPVPPMLPAPEGVSVQL